MRQQPREFLGWDPLCGEGWGALLATQELVPTWAQHQAVTTPAHPHTSGQWRHVCDQREDGALPDPGDPQLPGPCQQDCSVGDPGHPQDLPELQCGQGRAAAAEGHHRPRPYLGSGVDRTAIVDVLTNRSREQRQLIAQAFRERTQQDLLKSLQAALSGHLEGIVVALLQPAARLDARELRTALKDSGAAEDVGVEILATRTPPQLQECLAAYKHDFQVEAEEDIKSETSGTLQDLLLALAKGGRESYSEIIDYNLAEQDVQALKQAEGPSTEGIWVLILTQRNPEHLVRVFDQYQRRTGHELEHTVRNRFHGDAQRALLSLASVIRNTALYFAHKLHQALQETEPNYQALMRILISRSETDLLSIRAEFRRKFGKSLYSSLQDAVKGDCRLALLALCRAEDL
ncbi:annexin A9 isoform X2 [Myotis lucifugus]|uniref:annexin A9 isoform X2 n=1 Tax=Myotis lucifugus TaxID=59463 RepID=UPI000CCC4007|nr:annexin A9 isoform X2 [Myotis lucifugus]